MNWISSVIFIISSVIFIMISSWFFNRWNKTRKSRKQSWYDCSHCCRGDSHDSCSISRGVSVFPSAPQRRAVCSCALWKRATRYSDVNDQFTEERCHIEYKIAHHNPPGTPLNGIYMVEVSIYVLKYCPRKIGSWLSLQFSAMRRSIVVGTTRLWSL